MRWLLALVLPLALACGTESFKPEPILGDPEIFWALELNHHGVVLSAAAPYDTLRLVATPRNYLGEALAGLPAPQYVSRDPGKVAVTAEGTLVAEELTNQPIWVVASLTTGNTRHLDSAFVKVVHADPPPMLTGFSVHPLPPDSAKVATVAYALDGDPFSFPSDTLPVRAADAGGVPLDTLAGGIPVHFRSSDSRIVRVDPVKGIVTGLKPGTATVHASTTVFGVTKEDMLPYRIGYPVSASIGVGDPNFEQIPGNFNLPEWRVGVGAHVAWGFQIAFLSVFGAPADSVLMIEADITFDEADLPNVAAGDVDSTDQFAAHCGKSFFIFFSQISDCANSGNIMLGGDYWGGSAPYAVMIAIRRFPVPGTYEYRSTMHGTSGRIVVVDEQE